MDMEIRNRGGKKVDVDFRGFTIRTDQAIEDGGENSAPSPFEFFLASIGTCAGFYVYSFCTSREIDTEGITLRLRAEWTPDETRLETVRIQIQLPPDFPEKYRKAILRSADQCSVKKAIKNPPEFVITCEAVGA